MDCAVVGQQVISSPWWCVCCVLCGVKLNKNYYYCSFSLWEADVLNMGRIFLLLHIMLIMYFIWLSSCGRLSSKHNGLASLKFFSTLSTKIGL